MKNLLLIFSSLASLVLGQQDLNAISKSKYDAYRATAFEKQMGILKNRTTGCTSENVLIRKEWSTLSLPQRKNYINAVLCLQSLPAKTPKSLVPGAISRFDDFVVAHINKTAVIHKTSIFFHWHRYFLWVYEAALRDECGYTDAQPYWDWSANEATPESNGLFSGEGEGSIGGNGEFVELGDTILVLPTVPPTEVSLPPGTGGGCITSGPFVNYTVNLGPGAAPESYKYNPRCLQRDFRPYQTSTTATYFNITETMILPNITAFQDVVELQNTLHNAGHGGIGAAMLDLYASPVDPAFQFHHGQLDHVWNLWQAQDFESRILQVGMTLTFQNSPPSAFGTLDTPMDLGLLGGTYTIRELSSTIDGPFCFIYE